MVFITTNALSTGIVKLGDHEYSFNEKGYVKVIINGISNFYAKREYALTEEEANQQVNEMKRKRIDSLLRQIAKLENKPIKMNYGVNSL